MPLTVPKCVGRRKEQIILSSSKQFVGPKTVYLPVTKGTPRNANVCVPSVILRVSGEHRLTSTDACLALQWNVRSWSRIPAGIDKVNRSNENEDFRPSLSKQKPS